MTIPCSLADLQLLSYIAITGSYRGVSRMTGLAHTTVSRRINRLETQLGIPVIQPDTHPMMLTPWAARLIQSCDLQIAQIRDTITEAQLDFDQTRTIAIDETLLDLAPHLFSVIEAFKCTPMLSSRQGHRANRVFDTRQVFPELTIHYQLTIVWNGLCSPIAAYDMTSNDFHYFDLLIHR